MLYLAYSYFIGIAMNYDKTIAVDLHKRFEKGESVKEVCAQLGVDESTFNDWRKNHPDFDQAAEAGETIAEAYWHVQMRNAALGRETEHTPKRIKEVMLLRYNLDI